MKRYVFILIFLAVLALINSSQFWSMSTLIFSSESYRFPVQTESLTDRRLSFDLNDHFLAGNYEILLEIDGLNYEDGKALSVNLNGSFNGQDCDFSGKGIVYNNGATVTIYSFSSTLMDGLFSNPFIVIENIPENLWGGKISVIRDY